jgi:PAS domain S-box-containing protein
MRDAANADEIVREALADALARLARAESQLALQAAALDETRADVDRQRQAEVASAQQLAAIGAAFPDLVFLVDAEGKAATWQGGEGKGAPADHLSDALRDRVALVIAGETAAPWECQHPDGKWFEARVTRFGRDQALVVVRDTTDAKRQRDGLAREAGQATEAKGLSESALAEALIAVQAGFWEKDLESGALYWSEGLYALLGYDPRTTTPSDAAFDARVHPGDRHLIRGVPSGDRPIVEYRVELPGVGIRWLRAAISKRLNADGKLLRLRGIVTDHTAERALSKQVRRLAEVASRTSNAVIVADLQGRIEWVNEGFTRLTGWRLNEIIGLRPGDFLQGPDTDPTTRLEMSSALKSLQPFDCEVLNYAKDGRQYWVQVETRVVYDEDGTPSGFVGLETDVTERRITAQRDGLTQRVGGALLTSERLETAAAHVVAALVAEGDILAAQLWVVDPFSSSLVYVDGAAEPSAAGKRFLDISRQMRFRRGAAAIDGVGVPGAAWGERKPVVVSDLLSRDEGLAGAQRYDAALELGVSDVVATPILGPNEVLGVLEIAASRTYPGHEFLPLALDRVAEQVAAFLLQDSNRRAFRSIFEQSPDGLLLVDVEGRVQAMNARAEAMFGAEVGVAVGTLIEGGQDLVDSVLDLTMSLGPPLLYNRGAHGKAGDFSAEISVAATPTAMTHAAILAVRDLSERHAMEAAITRSLREKETLLKEVHHRVKNNLQIVSSLLTLQSETVADPTAQGALREMVLRVRSMSLVHQQLYGTEHLERIDFGDYACALGRFLHGSLEPAANFLYETERVEITVDTAVPCGLILNELVTNALKHGRSKDGTVTVRIGVQAFPEHFVMTVADKGRGLMGTSPPTSATLGFDLVRTLTRQIRARMDIAHEGGAVFRMHVPLGSVNR